jgi:hypothetical protein
LQALFFEKSRVGLFKTRNSEKRQGVSGVLTLGKILSQGPKNYFQQPHAAVPEKAELTKKPTL